MVEEAASAVDPKKRTELYAKAEGVLGVDEALIIPIYRKIAYCTDVEFPDDVLNRRRRANRTGKNQGVYGTGSIPPG